MNKKFQKRLEILGAGAFVKEYDNMPYFLRKAGTRYEIELVGGGGKRPYCVFVWDLARGEGVCAEMVEKHFDIATADETKALIEKLVEKYCALS